MTANDRFPQSLLQNPINVRKEYFYRKTIGHPRLEQAKQNALSFIDPSGEPDIMIVTGPTGVGKTTLAMKIQDQLLERNMVRMQSDKSHLPVIRIDAIPPEKEMKFDWSDFYTRLLQAFSEPCISQKQLFEDEIYMEQPISPVYAMNSLAALRRAVERTMKMRGTRTLIIDEANHLLMVDPKLMRRQFEIIKSLSQKCNVTIILIGTYDLLQILEQSAQLVRRGRVVHMARYDDYIPADKLAFKNALFTFQRHMPFKIEPDLIKHLNVFYLKSAGCIGILKKWLDNAVREGLNQTIETIDLDFILQYAHSNKSIQTVLNEAFIGESKLKDIDVRELRLMLKSHHDNLGKITTEESDVNISHDADPVQDLLPKLPPDKKSVKGQVGKRNPKRDATEVNYGLF